MRRRIYEISAIIILISVLLLSSMQATADPAIDASVVVTAMPDYSGGGDSGSGGGGGIPGPDIDDPSPGRVRLLGIIDRLGVFTRNITVESADGWLRLFIFAGTKGMIDNAIVPDEISIIRIGECMCPLPAGVVIIGSIYEIGPGGLQFSEPVSIAITYDDTWLAGNIDEESLYIAVCDGTDSTWKRILDSSVDTVANKITATISHFSAFAVFADLPVLPLQIAELNVNPAVVNGEKVVDIGVTVINTNPVQVTQTVSLMIDEWKADEQIVTLLPGEIEKVTFRVSRRLEGTYMINIEAQTVTFTVGSLLPEEPSDAAPPENPSDSTPPEKPSDVTPSVEESPSETPPELPPDISQLPEQKSSFLWYLVAFLGLLGFAVISWFCMRRQQNRKVGGAVDNEKTQNNG